MSNPVLENVISAILHEVIQEIVVRADLPDSAAGQVVSDNQQDRVQQSGFNENESICQHLINNACVTDECRNTITPKEVNTEALDRQEEDEILSNSNTKPVLVRVKNKQMIIGRNPKKEKSSKMKHTVKSPVLRRKEIRACLSLHNECESSGVLEELLTPSLYFQNSENNLEYTELRTDQTPSNSDNFLAESVDDDDSNFIDRNSSLHSKVRRGAMSWFPWKTLSFLLLISTAAIISADIEKAHGKFYSSNIGQFLIDIDQYDRVSLISQVMTDNYKEGKDWAEKTFSTYGDLLQPYYLLAQDKALNAKELVLLAYKKVQVMAAVGMDKLEENLPGISKQIDQLGDFTLSLCKAVLSKTQLAVSNAQRVTLDIVNGKISLCCLKEGALKQLEFVQGQFVAAYDFVRAYINK